MDLATKLQSAKVTLRSITRHDDESSTVRKVAVQKIKDFLDAEVKEMDARDQERTKLFDEPKARG